jgi:hypothetical protein
MHPAGTVQHSEFVRVVFGTRTNERFDQCRLAGAAPARDHDRAAAPADDARVDEHVVRRAQREFDLDVIFECLDERRAIGRPVDRLAVAVEHLITVLDRNDIVEIAARPVSRSPAEGDRTRPQGLQQRHAVTRHRQRYAVRAQRDMRWSYRHRSVTS